MVEPFRAKALGSRDRHVAAVRSAIREQLAALQFTGLESETVCFALSGGPDSLALTALGVPLAAEAGKRSRCLVVDHGLQSESARIAEWAAEQASRFGADEVRVLRARVGADGGPEAAARSARYAALREAAEHAPVLLGHTLDDQAETVLLGLARGSGPRSIAGMEPVREQWVRPLLGVRRADTEACCVALELTPWRDPHNSDPGFTRARLRAEVLPLLEEVLHGGVAPALARTARQVREDSAALDVFAEAEPLRAELAVSRLSELLGPVRRRVLRRWLHQRGVTGFGEAQLRAVEGLVTDWRGQGPCWLPGGYAVARCGEALTVTKPE